MTYTAPAPRRLVRGQCPRCETIDPGYIGGWRDSRGTIWHVARCGACLVIWLERP